MNNHHSQQQYEQRGYGRTRGSSKHSRPCCQPSNNNLNVSNDTQQQQQQHSMNAGLRSHFNPSVEFMIASELFGDDSSINIDNNNNKNNKK